MQTGALAGFNKRKSNRTTWTDEGLKSNLLFFNCSFTTLFLFYRNTILLQVLE